VNFSELLKNIVENPLDPFRIALDETAGRTGFATLTAMPFP